ncbi:MAG: exodeoxyribonuclease VII small subunit [Flavobacteriales bacterium]|nr:exodeoxyribonuclease VII small subunit [Flavobacteriales bacterium]
MHPEQQSYAEALQELESIIKKLETGQMPVDELANAVKRASELIHFCKSRLRDTQQQVNDVLKNLNE